MAADDYEPSDLDTTPLRLGEILAVAEMLPDHGGIPLEQWPGCRYLQPRHEGAQVASGVSLVGRVLALASLRIDLKRLARLFLPGPRAEDSTAI
jgi:hypothetical protein